jgi:hypothetical protein
MSARDLEGIRRAVRQLEQTLAGLRICRDDGSSDDFHLRAPDHDGDAA